MSNLYLRSGTGILITEKYALQETLELIHNNGPSSDWRYGTHFSHDTIGYDKLCSFDHVEDVRSYRNNIMTILINELKIWDEAELCYESTIKKLGRDV